MVEHRLRLNEVHAHEVIRTQLYPVITAGRTGNDSHHDAYGITAWAPFLRLMGSRIDGERRPAARRRQMRYARIIRDHEISMSKQCRELGPVGPPSKISEAPVVSIVLAYPRQLLGLFRRAHEHNVTVYFFQQHADQSCVPVERPIAGCLIAERRNDNASRTM